MRAKRVQKFLDNCKFHWMGDPELHYRAVARYSRVHVIRLRERALV